MLYFSLTLLFLVSVSFNLLITIIITFSRHANKIAADLNGFTVNYRNIYCNCFLQREPESQLYFVMASLTRVKICIGNKKHATALIYGGKTNKRPA